MAKQSIITNAGLELLATSSKVSGQHYWLGYYALAYVPSAWKSGQTELPDCAPEGFQLGSLPNEALSYRMQNLTVAGDIIYNVFQGDLVGTGYRRGSDGSAAGNLFGLSMYDQNIKKHYRYCLDAHGNNQLLAWENADRTKPMGSLIGAAIYNGTNGFDPGEMPIPAPLFHAGDVTGKFSVSNYFPDITNEVTNGSSIYKYAAYNYGAGEHMIYPLVSADYRGYTDTLGGDETAAYAHKTAGTQFDDKELAVAVLPGISGDVTAWFSSYSTTVTDVGAYTGTIADTLWKVASISNYNRYHAPISSLGNTLNSDLASRNMSTVTKFFPIANYKVINSVSGFTSDKELREVATSIALTVDVDLSPSTKANGFDESNFNYDENANLTFFDKYADNQGDFTRTSTSFKFNRIGIYAVALNDTPYTIRRADDAELPGTICDVQFSINPDVEPILFAVVDFDNTVYLSDTGDGLHRFRADINLNLDAAGEDSLIYDSELVRDSVIFYNMYQDDALTWYQNQLIATASTQNAIMEFGLELTNLKARLGELACCPTPNYDERYALKNHSHGKAIRNIEDAAIAINGGLRGYDTVKDGSEDGIFDESPYVIGIDSVVLGKDTATMADHSFIYGVNSVIAAGVGSYIDNEFKANAANKNNVRNSHIFGGVDSAIINSVHASIIAASNAKIISSDSSSIIASNSVNLNYAPRTVVIGSDMVDVTSADTCLVMSSRDITLSDADGANNTLAVIGGYGHTVGGSSNSLLLSGYRNAMNYGSGTIMIGGQYNIYDGSSNHDFKYPSVIVGGWNHSITDGDNYGFNTIFGGNRSVIESSLDCIILGGVATNGTTNQPDTEFIGNTISNCVTMMVYGFGNIASHTTYGMIVGLHNKIDPVTGGDEDLSAYWAKHKLNFVFGANNELGRWSSTTPNLYNMSNFIVGCNHVMADCDYGLIIGGHDNIVRASSGASVISATYSSILDTHGTVINASIIGGSYNQLYVNNSLILGGDHNTITQTPYNKYCSGNSVILGGRYCRADMFGEIAHSNGRPEIPWDVKSAGSITITTPNNNSYTTDVDNIVSETKHSIIMFSAMMDTWKSANGGVIPSGSLYDPNSTTGSDASLWRAFRVLTADGKEQLNLQYDNTNASNVLEIAPGESVSGTVKFMIHIPYIGDVGCWFDCDGDGYDDTRTNTGAVYYGLHSFGAFRDLKGRIIVSDQLINESAACHGYLPVSAYGITTGVHAWSEMNAHAPAESTNQSAGFMSSSDGYVDPNDATNVDVGFARTSHATYHSGKLSGAADNQTDLKMGGAGSSGAILFTINLDIPFGTFKDRYKCRLLKCTAVIDILRTRDTSLMIPEW